MAVPVAAVRSVLCGIALLLACTACSTPGTAPAQPVIGTAAPGLLRPAPGGDGDSWKDIRGREYRLGLVNAPEYDECFGTEATRERKRLVASGFRADSYMIDRYGRHVSDVTLADGRDLNVLLAEEGFVDDRYLAQFRHENPALAGRLDVAFRSARAARVGLWGSCAAR